MGAKHANDTSFGGSKGNKPGRKKGDPTNIGVLPEVFRKRMALIAARNRTAANVERILDDADHPQFMKALEFAATRGYGKPAETVEHKGTVGVKVIFGKE